MKREVSQQAAQIAAAFAVGQSGCVIVVVTFAALAVGLWVDKHLRPTVVFAAVHLWQHPAQYVSAMADCDEHNAPRCSIATARTA